MSNVSQSVSSTVVAVLGTIGVTANTAVKAVNNVAASMDMLDAYVSKAKVDQQISYRLNAKDNLRRLIHEAAEARAVREHALEQRMSVDSRLAQLFKSAESEFEGMFPELQAS